MKYGRLSQGDVSSYSKSHTLVAKGTTSQRPIDGVQTEHTPYNGMIRYNNDLQVKTGTRAITNGTTTMPHATYGSDTMALMTHTTAQNAAEYYGYVDSRSSISDQEDQCILVVLHTDSRDGKKSLHLVLGSYLGATDTSNYDITISNLPSGWTLAVQDDPGEVPGYTSTTSSIRYQGSYDMNKTDGLSIDNLSTFDNISITINSVSGYEGSSTYLTKWKFKKSTGSSYYVPFASAMSVTLRDMVVETGTVVPVYEYGRFEIYKNGWTPLITNTDIADSSTETQVGENVTLKVLAGIVKEFFVQSIGFIEMNQLGPSNFSFIKDDPAWVGTPTSDTTFTKDGLPVYITNFNATEGSRHPRKGQNSKIIASQVFLEPILGDGKIFDVTLTSQGSGYVEEPTVVFNAGGGTGLVARAVIENHKLTNIEIINGGSGYRQASCHVVISGGGGVGAVARVTGVINGSITQFTIDDQGDGYQASPYIIVIDGGTGASATAHINGVTSITIPGGGIGSGFTSAPAVVITDPSGEGCEATATVAGGKVIAVTIHKTGKNYTSPTVSFVGGGGTGAAGGTAVVGTGKVTEVILEKRGQFYVDPPAITLIGGGANGANVSNPATAISTLADGKIVGIDVLNGGSGYADGIDLTSPAITISGGSGSGAQAVVTVEGSTISSVKMTNYGSGYHDVADDPVYATVSDINSNHFGIWDFSVSNINVNFTFNIFDACGVPPSKRGNYRISLFQSLHKIWPFYAPYAGQAVRMAVNMKPMWGITDSTLYKWPDVSPAPASNDPAPNDYGAYKVEIALYGQRSYYSSSTGVAWFATLSKFRNF